ncbi:Fis family transcriptional regulator [Isoptericola sp. BMS4]|uniref:Fis family transcriptional regulator n=1 Tax=Isoptericola sp. BMS4 TaxID=2527875 RepID=UPI0014230E1E|nr:Fis family transcriptional regulator [Isoptericola sp. BMS4]
MSIHEHPAATFGPTGDAIEITRLVIDDPDVITEARRWTSGERGPAVDDVEALRGADMTRFVTEAVGLGARAIAATGQTQEAQELGRLIHDVGERAAGASDTAAKATARAAKEATETIAKAADAARQAVTDAETARRKEFGEAVTKAAAELNDLVTRVVGGENPELLEKLRPLLATFGADLDAKVTRQTGELLEKAARQFDPSDPTSPMAKHAAALKEQYEGLTKSFAESLSAVSTKLDALEKAVAVDQATGHLAQATPLKGDTFEQAVHRQMAQIATGLADEYAETGDRAGALPYNKKGDGVLHVDGGTARVVVETTDSARRHWGPYLEEAERNRDAAAALGVVRTPEQNDGHVIRLIGARRFVIAFDPENGDVGLLRTVVQLLRTAALAATRSTGDQEIDTANEKVTSAVARLGALDTIKSTAEQIGTKAAKIERGCDKIQTEIRRDLEAALTALAGAQDAEQATVTALPGTGVA